MSCAFAGSCRRLQDDEGRGRVQHRVATPTRRRRHDGRAQGVAALVIALALLIASCSSGGGKQSHTYDDDSAEFAGDRNLDGADPSDLADRNAPVHAGPFPDAGGSPLEATGGPYISHERARDLALQGFDCSLGGPQKFSPTDTGCLRVDVTFFKRYADAWAARGNAGGFVTSWGPNHEMYVVTVWGKLALSHRPHGPTGPGHKYSLRTSTPSKSTPRPARGRCRVGFPCR